MTDEAVALVCALEDFIVAVVRDEASEDVEDTLVRDQARIILRDAAWRLAFAARGR